MKVAYLMEVYGTVQGVGFRPFVYRLAHEHKLTGWVLNDDEGVKIWFEGNELKPFLNDVKTKHPPSSRIDKIKVKQVSPKGFGEFTIKESQRNTNPVTQISADLAVCEDCLSEMHDPNNRRYGYPYINCTHCGPRYSIITALPYDRPNTTMKAWKMCEACQQEYDNPLDRRFHAQPIACPNCGPRYCLKHQEKILWNAEAIRETANLLTRGKIAALKGLGGYHLACDAKQTEVIKTLRERKFRKEKAFAVMVKNLEVAAELVHLSEESRKLLTSIERPVVLLQKKQNLAEVAPFNHYLGVMLPYTPLHHLLFDAGAPDALVMTSANRSSEPINYQDEAAREQLKDIADAFLIGERPIARRIDDSVIRPTKNSSTFFRRARGYAPRVVTILPTKEPILAVGADLKNTITLVVDGQAFISQYIGDLEHYGAFQAFQETIDDLTDMYGVKLEDCTIAHDAHPNYRSTQYALELPAKKHIAVQHHRAHIASVLAEKQAWNTRILGIVFDGTGYGDDGAIWGGEFFVGSLKEGFKRVGHLDYAKLVGGDAAAKYPVQAAAGFLADMDTPDLTKPPFNFPDRYVKALQLLEKDIQVLPTSSVGRLFDTVAALLGFTREMSFEGQAAMWLEYLAKGQEATRTYSFPLESNVLNWQALLQAIAEARTKNISPKLISANFHYSVIKGVLDTINEICKDDSFDTTILSGGVFQNEIIANGVRYSLRQNNKRVWLQQAVATTDEGLSLGQAALVLNWSMK